MKGLAEKCIECIANSRMMELSAFKQRASEPARKKQCIVCIKKLTNQLLACFILCGHTNTCKGCIEKIYRENLNPNCLICRKDIKFVNNVDF